jgi:hypothetical protein
MRPIVYVVLLLVVDKAIGIIFVLYKPASPEVVYAFLITRGTGYSESMKVHSPLNYVCWVCDLIVNDYGISLEEDILEKVIETIFRFNAASVSDLS